MNAGPVLLFGSAGSIQKTWPVIQGAEVELQRKPVFSQGTKSPLPRGVTITQWYAGRIAVLERRLKLVSDRRLNLGSESVLAGLYLGVAITCMYTLVAMGLIIVFL